MPTRQFSLIVGLSIAIALSGGTGAARQKFSCDVNTQNCTCEGVETGADCQAMKKNCGTNKMACIDPITYPGQKAHCMCTMGRKAQLLKKTAPLDDAITVTPQ